MIGHLPGSGVTDRHYFRPVTDTHNKKRAEIRTNSDLPQEKRLKLHWDAWVDACGDPFQGLPDMTVSDA
jgi:hypothetical protein